MDASDRQLSVVRAWRLIVDDPREGAENMAVDWAILEAYERGDVPSTLRLYGWSRPTASLGKFQPVDDVDLNECAARGVDVCRRPTGGRGVLHDDEVTYSMVTGVRDGLPRGVAASYRVLCDALVAAYREIGIDAGLTARPRGASASGSCYLHATPADLSVGVAKLSGSAQVWLHDACLQHGSFVISRDVQREAAVFRLDDRAASALEATTETIELALGARPLASELQAAIVLGIGHGLGVELAVGPLTDLELECAAQLRGRYAIG